MSKACYSCQYLWQTIPIQHKRTSLAAQTFAFHLPGGLHRSLNAGGVEHGHANRQGDHPVDQGPEDIAIALRITWSQDSCIDGLLHSLPQHPKASNTWLVLTRLPSR